LPRTSAAVRLLLVSLLLLSAGCTYLVTPREVPERPNQVTEGNVGSYVHDHAAAVLYNELHTPDDTRVSTTCRTALGAALDSGYFVAAGCSGIDESTSGPLPLFADVTGSAGEYVGYYVDNETTRRVGAGATDRRPLEPYRAADPDENTGSGIRQVRVYNFDETDHEVTLSVTHVGSGEGVLGSAVALGNGTGVVYADVTVREGTYELRARTGDAERTLRWTVAGPAHEEPTPTVLLTPDGRLVVLAAPFHRVTL
jgi:hypothetical protein